MKSKVTLSDFLPHLPGEMRDGLDEALKQAECPAELHRSVATASLDADGERIFTGYASTRSIDRDGEVVMPNGMDLTQFRKAPVLLWGHKWSEPPVGKDHLVESDGYGIKTVSELADTALALDLWKLVQGKMLNTSSIGYIPLEYQMSGMKGWGGLMDELKKWPEWDGKSEPLAFVTKAILLEHSLVSVPANIDALITSIKELNLVVLGKEFAARERTVVPGGATVVTKAATPEPKTFEPRLVKSAAQVSAELQIECARIVAEEIERRMGRV